MPLFSYSSCWLIFQAFVRKSELAELYEFWDNLGSIFAGSHRLSPQGLVIGTDAQTCGGALC